MHAHESLKSFLKCEQIERNPLTQTNDTKLVIEQCLRHLSPSTPLTSTTLKYKIYNNNFDTQRERERDKSVSQDIGPPFCHQLEEYVHISDTTSIIKFMFVVASR